MNITLKFLGAAGTVTGSKYLISVGSRRILVDCGLFQGNREWNERNWNDPDIDLSTIDVVLLTHAHIDHIGLLPRYYNQGLKCPIYCSKATQELAKLLLEDSARLQEEEAQYRGERGKSRHKPPLPLYRVADAVAVAKLQRVVPFNKALELFPQINATWHGMGHILGAAAITLNIGDKRIVFSGDVGRYGVPILEDPQPVEFGDLLLIESTYGDRLHPVEHPRDRLAKVINETFKRGGVVVIPSFAVGRTQLLLFYIRELKERGSIPDLPIYVDSPMATDATEIYSECSEGFDRDVIAMCAEGNKPFSTSKLYFTRSREDSIRLNSMTEPMVIISASGMLTGGRILHHLKHRISDQRNTILFVGFQPPGSRGEWIQHGAKSLRLIGDEVQIRAHIDEISALSAHADRDELLRWCKSSSGRPGRVAVVHGEPESALSFRDTLTRELGWDCFVARYLEEIEV
jgi:metallo-beta-lactamase family protein